MARSRSPARPGFPPALRRARAFVLANVVLWAGLGAWYLFQPAERQQEVVRLVSNAFDERKQVTAFDVVQDLWQLYYSQDYVTAIAPGDRKHVYGGAPRGPEGVRVLRNEGYVVGYSDALGNPLWAAYRAQDIEPVAAPPRPEQFSLDLRSAARIEPGDYSGSGYDRGHLAPNFVIATRYGRRAQEETFLMTNVTPQRHTLNSGLWRELEQRVASSYSARFGEIWVVAGPVFGDKPPRLRRRVAVPEACYMILLDESAGRVRTTAYLFPQKAPPDGRLDDYLVTIDEIERRTGLDFFAELPDDAETALEARRAERSW